MKPLRWLAAGLVWILAGLLALVGGLLSLTVLLLPLGIPLLMLARRLFSLSGRLVVPRGMRHPVQETGRTVRRRKDDLQKSVPRGTKGVRQGGRKFVKKARKSTPSAVRPASPGWRWGPLAKRRM